MSGRPGTTPPFSALVFKIMTDPYVGQLAFIRVYSGVLATGATIYNPRQRRKERIGRLLKMHADKREDIKQVYAGDIAAAVGLKSVATGDTICDHQHPVVLEAIAFPNPVIALAIEPKTKADQEKLGQGLAKLTREDPTFMVKTDEETGQVVISGMGELHLEIIVDRLRREFGVAATVGRPQVAYREALTKSAEAEGRYVKQTGGRGQYGHVKLRVVPGQRVPGFCSRTRSSAARCPRSSSGRSRMRPGGDHHRRTGRVRDRGRQRGVVRRVVARTSTRPRWRSRSRGRWRSAPQRDGHRPSCWSRS